MSCNQPRTSGQCTLIRCPQMSDVVFLVAAVFGVLVVLAQTQKKQTHFLLNIDAVAK